MIWIQQHAELLFCLVGCMLVTVIPRVGPVSYTHLTLPTTELV